MSKNGYKKLQSSVKKELGKVISETEEKIHHAIRENNTEFLNWFFFSCIDKDKFMKLFDNKNFNDKEKSYLRNFLEEMGKI